MLPQMLIWLYTIRNDSLSRIIAFMGFLRYVLIFMKLPSFILCNFIVLYLSKNIAKRDTLIDKGDTNGWYQ